MRTGTETSMTGGDGYGPGTGVVGGRSCMLEGFVSFESGLRSDTSV